MLDEKNIGNDSSSLFNGNHFPSLVYIETLRITSLLGDAAQIEQFATVVQSSCSSLLKKCSIFALLVNHFLVYSFLSLSFSGLLAFLFAAGSQLSRLLA